MTEREAVLREYIVHHEKSLDDHEKRIRSLEKTHWKMTGIITVAAFAAPFIATAIIKLT